MTLDDDGWRDRTLRRDYERFEVGPEDYAWLDCVTDDPPPHPRHRVELFDERDTRPGIDTRCFDRDSHSDEWREPFEGKFRWPT